MTAKPEIFKHTHFITDLNTIVQRRQAITLLAGTASAAFLSSCGRGSSAQNKSADSTELCQILPEETNGPYPADGSNNANGSLANVLTDSGLIRDDMRSSFGDLTGTAEGVPLEMELSIVNAQNGCAPLPGYLVYVWHCTDRGP